MGTRRPPTQPQQTKGDPRRTQTTEEQLVELLRTLPRKPPKRVVPAR